MGQYGEEPCTAHDLYFAMHEAAFFAACEGFSAPRILKLERRYCKNNWPLTGKGLMYMERLNCKEEMR